MKSYEHSNLSRASVVQFRASRNIMSPNRTFERNFMTIRISRVLPLIIFESLDILCPRIRHPSEMWWQFEVVESFRCLISSVSISDVPKSDIRVKSYDNFKFSRASIVQFRVSRYIICLNRISIWKVMTIWISRELSLFNFERLDILCAWIGHLSEQLWPFELLKSFHCSISNLSIYYVPESDIRVIS